MPKRRSISRCCAPNWREVLEAEHVQVGSHDYKEFVAVFNSFPKEELFRARVAELRAQIRLVLDLKNAGEVRLSLQSDPVRGNVIALVIMPREHFSAERPHEYPGGARASSRRQAGLLLPGARR